MFFFEKKDIYSCGRLKEIRYAEKVYYLKDVGYFVADEEIKYAGKKSIEKIFFKEWIRSFGGYGFMTSIPKKNVDSLFSESIVSIRKNVDGYVYIWYFINQNPELTERDFEYIITHDNLFNNDEELRKVNPKQDYILETDWLLRLLINIKFKSDRISSTEIDGIADDVKIRMENIERVFASLNQCCQNAKFEKFVKHLFNKYRIRNEIYGVVLNILQNGNAESISKYIENHQENSKDKTVLLQIGRNMTLDEENIVNAAILFLKYIQYQRFDVDSDGIYRSINEEEIISYPRLLDDLMITRILYSGD